jgi:hypothetical protein
MTTDPCYSNIVRTSQEGADYSCAPSIFKSIGSIGIYCRKRLPDLLRKIAYLVPGQIVEMAPFNLKGSETDFRDRRQFKRKAGSGLPTRVVLG